MSEPMLEEKPVLAIMYVWRVLDGDRLVEPEDQGPHYDKTSLNGFRGFKSEAEAIKALEDWVTSYSLWTSGDFVLVKTYTKIHYLNEALKGLING